MRAYRARVAVSIVLLLAAKLATVAVPLLLKRIIDVLSQARLPVALPAALLVGYALLRFASTLFNEWRNLLFARVTLSTVSAYALDVRPPACAGAALSRPAPGRQPVAGHRPRHQRHRVPAGRGAVHDRAYARRDRSRARRDAAPLPWRLCRHHCRDISRVHGLHARVHGAPRHLPAARARMRTCCGARAPMRGCGCCSSARTRTWRAAQGRSRCRHGPSRIKKRRANPASERGRVGARCMAQAAPSGLRRLRGPDAGRWLRPGSDSSVRRSGAPCPARVPISTRRPSPRRCR